MDQGPAPLTNADVIAEFRSNGGRVGGMFTGAPLVLLTTRGARSGKPRTTPVVALRDEGRTVVFGTNAGADSDPAWLHNLRATPLVEVEEPGADGLVEKFTAQAVEASAPEASRLFDRQVELDPAFAGYRTMTERQIPAVILNRIS